MNTSRKQFIKAAVLGGVGASLAAESASVTVCNPLLRTPLSLIIDDSCPVINKAYYWIKQRHEWRLRHAPDKPGSGWERHFDKLDKMPNTIPSAFAAKWGEWCGEQGVRGKFSMVPFPAGVGRIDRGFDGFPKNELRDWLRVTKEIIWQNFDLTPEMLTHTRVVDLKTWQLTDAWEQGEWVDPPVELLTDYITTAMQLLKNVGITCEGVTSPGAFGKKKESAYARAVLDAALRVNKNPQPFYFLHMKLSAKELPDVPLWHVDNANGRAVASIIGCAGDWFGATGFDTANADLFITEDLRGGRLPSVLEKERPCILVGHWPCFYVNDGPGFKVLKEVKRRLDAYDPDRTKTLWMKNSEIGHYWMARTLSDIKVESADRVQIQTKFPTRNFTLGLDVAAKRVKVDKRDLWQVSSRRDFRAGTFLVEGRRTFLAFDLPTGKTTVTMIKEGS
ncbi:MAG: hypothetical protein FJ395_07955 [Verrucomicrobia bacterium]|nr:hypothetical protein [Verrucomicrobiota bacterium]